MASESGDEWPELRLVAEDEAADVQLGGSPGSGAGPGALWGLGQIATYLGRSRETVRLYWQATKARAVDPSAVSVVDALPDPDFLLPDKSTGVYGFFNVGGAQHVEDWWTLPAVRPAWRPEVIAAWASATGRAVREHGSGYRLPVPLYLDLPALPDPLPRIADQVIDVPAGYRTTATKGLHVRIWDGPLPPSPGTAATADAEAVSRTVVLLAPTGETHGFAHHDHELAGFVLEAGLLTTEQARRALWFWHGTASDPSVEGARMVYRPDFAYISFEILQDSDSTVARELPLRHRAGQRLTAVLHRLDGDASRRPLHYPNRFPATVGQLEHLVGQRLEIYPPGTQTAQNIGRWAAGERPVPIDWDPYGITDDLTHLPVLVKALDAARAGLASEPEENRRAAAHRVAVLRAAAHWLADLAWSKVNLNQQGDFYASDQLRAVEQKVPVPTERERALVDQALADKENDRYDYTIIMRDRPAITALADRPSIEPGDEALRAALSHALTVVDYHFGVQVPHRVRDHPVIATRVDLMVPAVLTWNGNEGLPAHERAHTAAYLQTIAWWGPRPEDRDAAGLLARLFFDHERETGIDHGYDPFGRLVLRCQSAQSFAVNWPVDGAIGVADIAHPDDHQFRQLPDGRVDLHPIGSGLTLNDDSDG